MEVPLQSKNFFVLFGIIGAITVTLFFAGCGTSVVTLYSKDVVCETNKKDQPKENNKNDTTKKVSRKWLTGKN